MFEPQKADKFNSSGKDPFGSIYIYIYIYNIGQGETPEIEKNPFERVQDYRNEEEGLRDLYYHKTHSRSQAVLSNSPNYRTNSTDRYNNKLFVKNFSFSKGLDKKSSPYFPNM